MAEDFGVENLGGNNEIDSSLVRMEGILGIIGDDRENATFETRIARITQKVFPQSEGFLKDNPNIADQCRILQEQLCPPDKAMSNAERDVRGINPCDLNAIASARNGSAYKRFIQSAQHQHLLREARNINPCDPFSYHEFMKRVRRK